MKEGVLGLRVFLRKHVKFIMLAYGLLTVVVWTVYRHISNGINYDVVGQIGVSQQWAHSAMVYVQFGATNYLFKMPVYLVINSIHFISPMNRLLIFALVFNLATYAGLYLLFIKFAKLLQLKTSKWFLIPLLWLSTIYGNVFWADYANSRNLEVLGGLVLIYLYLKYLERRKNKDLVWLSFAASIVFFSDPLQMYVCGGGIILYCLYLIILKRNIKNLQLLIKSIAVLVVAYVGSKLLSVIVRKLLPVHFLVAPNNTPSFSFYFVLKALRGLAEGILKIFGMNFFQSPYSVNNVRLFVNFFVFCIVIFIIYSVLFKPKYRNVLRLLWLTLLSNVSVYVISGQVLEKSTERYLIMFPIILALILALYIDEIHVKHRNLIRYILLACILSSSVLVYGAMLHSWPERHVKDRSAYNVAAFMLNNSYDFGFSSREIGVTTTYLTDAESNVIPLGCSSDHTVFPTYLFYDQGSLKKMRTYTKDIPIIIPPEGIKYLTNCSREDVIKEFGTPKQESTIEGTGTALLYSADVFKKLQ